MAQKRERQTEIVEDGDIFFLYRPTVEEDEPEGSRDVQRFHVVLRPRGGGKLRLLVVARKHLPDTGKHERTWGFVDMVTTSEQKIEKALQEQEYRTRTRGRRRLPAARPAGEGVYAVTLENGQMHLSHALELPKQPGEVQKALKIPPEASYTLSVKNPEAGQPANAGLRGEDKADYPKKLQEEFRGRRFAREDVHLLDYEGVEFVMVGARRDPEKAYGLDLDTEDEDYGHAEIIQKLRMTRSRHPVKPLFEGHWA